MQKLPDWGKSLLIFRNYLLQKYFGSLPAQIRSLIRPIPCPQEGRFAIVTGRGAGCGGREGVRRERQSQGEMNLVSEVLARRMIGAFCVRSSRVVLAPVAGAKLSEANRARPGSASRQSGSDGDKTNSSPGRARSTPLKPLRGECRVISGVTVVTTLVSVLAIHTRLRAHRAPGIPCALRYQGGGTFRDKPRAKTRGEIAKLCLPSLRGA